MDGKKNNYKEENHLIVRQTPIFLGLKIVVLEFVFSVVYLLLRTPFHFFGIDFPYVSESFLFYVIIYSIFTLFEVMGILSIFLLWENEYYEITQGEIIHHKGVLHHNRNIYSLDNIESINLQQSFIGRLFNFGTITLKNPLLNKNIYLYVIPNPRKYLQIIQKQVNRSDQGRRMFIRE